MDHLSRFRADLETLTGAPPRAELPLAMAVSGGGDSLALLLLAQAAYPGAVLAATVDHELRPEAADEARHVAGICAELAVPHDVLRLGPERNVELHNLQDRARAARYWLLGEWAAAKGAPWIATAHQREDVAEGFLMRAARGAGVQGLAAMPSSRANDGPGYRTRIVRPLLDWTRAELALVAAEAGVRTIADLSNVDPRFDRARFRRLLADTPELPVDRLARAARNLRDADDAIEWAIGRELHRFEDMGQHVWLQADGLPFELKRRLAVRAIDEVRLSNGLFADWRKTAVADLVHSLERDTGFVVADVLAEVRRGRWRFRLAPPRRSD